MPTISVHFSETEYKLVSQHIKSKGMTISQYIKAILLEEIEDEYDVSIVNEYLEKKFLWSFYHLKMLLRNGILSSYSS